MKKLNESGRVLTGCYLSPLERAYDKAYAWFFAYPTKEFSMGDIVDNLGISKTTSIIVMNQLKNDGVIEINRIGKSLRIKAIATNPLFRSRKIVSNLKQVYECKIIDWIREEVPNNRSIILFGSYRKGDDIEGSDLDIAVEVIGNERLRIIPVMITHLGYRKNVTINIHIFSRKAIDLNLFSNIANGIGLDGFLEVRL